MDHKQRHILSEMNSRRPFQAKWDPGTTQAKGKLVPIHTTQLHLAYGKDCSKALWQNIKQASVLILPLHPRQNDCGKTPKSNCAHPAISSQAKELWQNMYQLVCSPCHFIPGEKRQEKTTPFGVNIMRSPVLYRAAQAHYRQKQCGKTPTSKCAHPAISSQAISPQKNCCKTCTSKCAHPSISFQAQALWQQVQASVLTLPFHPRRPCARQHGQQWGPSPSSHGAQLAATLLGTPDSAPPTQPVLPGICKSKGPCLVAYSDHGNAERSCQIMAVVTETVTSHHRESCHFTAILRHSGSSTAAMPTDKSIPRADLLSDGVLARR